jgi:hypothetical protein
MLRIIFSFLVLAVAAHAQFGNATKIRGRAIAETDPTNGHTLIYNSTTGKWAPGAVTSASGGDVAGASNLTVANRVAYIVSSGTLTASAGLAFNPATNSLGVIGDVTIGQSSTATGAVKINGLTSGTVTISAADAAGTWTLKLPTSAGSGSGLPVLSGTPWSYGTVTGNTTQFATWTGATTASRCVHTDASGNLTISAADCGAGAGDVTGQAASVDSEVALFSGTGGKMIKRASLTGIPYLTSGVIGSATAANVVGLFNTGTCSGYLKSDGTCDTPAGAGDVVGQASSVDSEVALFSGTGGKTIKRSSLTGIPYLTSGVIGSATSTNVIGLWSGTCNNTTFLRADGSCSAPSGSGDVVGPSSATDNAIVRFDSTTGKVVQNSSVTVDDSGNISTAGTASFGVGGSTAGGVEMKQGTANSPAANSVLRQAPASVTAYTVLEVGSAGSGFYYGTNSSGTVTTSQVASTGSGNVVLATSPVLVTPNLGTPSALVLTNATGTPASIVLTNASGLPDVALTSNVPLKNGSNSYTGTQDASGATRTAPTKVGTSAPGTCTVGDLFYDSDAGTPGQNLYGCTATNTWTLLGDGGGSGANLDSATGDIGTAQIEAGAVTLPKLAFFERHIVLTGSGTAGVLQDADDQPAVWFNQSGGNMTIAQVWCQTDSATVTSIQLQRDDGSATNMLSSDLNCSTTKANTTTFVSGENVLADGHNLNAVIVSAGGAGKWVAIHLKVTY